MDGITMNKEKINKIKETLISAVTNPLETAMELVFILFH